LSNSWRKANLIKYVGLYTVSVDEECAKLSKPLLKFCTYTVFKTIHQP